MPQLQYRPRQAAFLRLNNMMYMHAMSIYAKFEKLSNSRGKIMQCHIQRKGNDAWFGGDYAERIKRNR